MGKEEKGKLKTKTFIEKFKDGELEEINVYDEEEKKEEV